MGTIFLVIVFSWCINIYVYIRAKLLRWGRGGGESNLYPLLSSPAGLKSAMGNSSIHINDNVLFEFVKEQNH